MVRRSEIELKTSGEVDAMREAGRVVARCLDAVRAAATVGTSLKELDGVAHDVMQDAGAVPAFLDYHPHFAPSPFPGVICASVNDAVVHAIPGSHRLAEGDLLSVDCGAFLDGWCGDAAISLVVGPDPDPADLALIATTEHALAGRDRGRGAGREARRPGRRDRCGGPRGRLRDARRPRRPRHRARHARGAARAERGPRRAGHAAARGPRHRDRADAARRWRGRATSTTPTGGPCGPPTAAGRRTWSTPSRSPTTARGC